jgi:hypothetical protein
VLVHGSLPSDWSQELPELLFAEADLLQNFLEQAPVQVTRMHGHGCHDLTRDPSSCRFHCWFWTIGRGYCTDYALEKLNELSGKSIKLTDLGNAADWNTSAKRLGFTVIPATDYKNAPPGAIAVWKGTNNATADGHVAVVKSNKKEA